MEDDFFYWQNYYLCPESSLLKFKGADGMVVKVEFDLFFAASSSWFSHVFSKTFHADRSALRVQKSQPLFAVQDPGYVTRN